MGKSTKSKPAKPRPDFPLFAHPSGQWAKKVLGATRYFGTWDNPKAAERRWKREEPYLREGKEPPPEDKPVVDEHQWCTMKILCDSFCNAKLEMVDVGELSIHSFKDYHETCARMVAFFGKDRRVDDIKFDEFSAYRKELGKTLNANSLGNEINRTKIVFRWAYKHDLIAREMKYGDSFNRPKSTKVRAEKRESGKRLFTAAEVLAILAECRPALKAMVLLGINCGFGNTDCASLPKSAVDLKSGWIDFPRPKTQEDRVVPLWPETLEALRAAAKVRPRPKDDQDNGLWFITRHGKPYVRMDAKEGLGPEKATRKDSVTGEFGKILKRLHINGRKNLGFYSLRHTFETIAQRANNQVAVNAIMGHVDNTMAARYREEVYKPHLEHVVHVVRAWLWPDLYEEGWDLPGYVVDPSEMKVRISNE